MASWRETASQEEQNDLDSLLEPSLGFAQQQLDNRGEFYPFAICIHSDGQTEMVTGDLDSRVSHPQSTDILATCPGSSRGPP